MKALGWTTAIIGTFVLGPIWGGYILSILWGWFFVPIFHLPQVSIALAIGIGLVVRMLTYSSPPESQSSKDKDLQKAFIQALFFTFLYPLLLLAIGAIVRAFV